MSEIDDKQNMADAFLLESRPRCLTCPHFVLHNMAGEGHCSLGPPRAYPMVLPQAQPRPPAGGLALPGGQAPPQMQIETRTITLAPQMRAIESCGDHPDFKAWYQKNRGAISEALKRRAAKFTQSAVPVAS